MTASLHDSGAAGRAMFGVMFVLGLGLGLGTQTHGQSSSPCAPRESVLSLGKAAFFKSIERGAFAIGERSLEDLTDGLGGSTPPRPPGGLRRPRVSAPAQARLAVFPPATDASLAGALTAYIESPSSEAADAALSLFFESSTKILFEAPPETRGDEGRVGLVLEGGQFVNRSASFEARSMTSESARSRLEFELFGDGPDLNLAAVNALLGAQPFFKAPVIADTRNVDRNNLGLAIKTDQDLRDLWFEDYRTHLAAAEFAPSQERINEALNAGWPTLQKFWAFKRTGIFIDRALMTFGNEMREVYERVTSGNADTAGASGCTEQVPGKQPS